MEIQLDECSPFFGTGISLFNKHKMDALLTASMEDLYHTELSNKKKKKKKLYMHEHHPRI